MLSARCWRWLLPRCCWRRAGNTLSRWMGNVEVRFDKADEALNRILLLDLFHEPPSCAPFLLLYVSRLPAQSAVIRQRQDTKGDILQSIDQLFPRYSILGASSRCDNLLSSLYEAWLNAHRPMGSVRLRDIARVICIAYPRFIS